MTATAPERAAGAEHAAAAEDAASAEEAGTAAGPDVEETAAGAAPVDEVPAEEATADDVPAEEATAEAEVAEEGEEEEAGEDDAAPRIRLGRLPGWVPIVSAVLIVVFLATTGILSWRLYEGHAREVSRNDVLRIVPSYAARIFSFDYRHLDQDAKAAHPLLVGAYRDDYDQSMKRRAPDYEKYHFIVKSTVASAGVSDASADQVRVVAFIDQTVTAGVPKSATTEDQIRLALTFERHDGSWLLAKVTSV